MEMRAKLGVPCTIAIDGREIDGLIYLGLEGIYLYRKRLLRKPVLEFYIPYNRVMKVVVKNYLVYHKIELMYHNGFEVKRMKILGNKKIGEVGRRLDFIKRYGLY